MFRLSPYSGAILFRGHGTIRQVPDADFGLSGCSSVGIQFSLLLKGLAAWPYIALSFL
jgi:hypothetical protein